MNLYLYWETDKVIDRVDRWEMTVGLVDQSPEERCTVDVTPRRVQQFKPEPGTVVRWTNVFLTGPGELQNGEATVDQNGLIRMSGVRVGKGKNRLAIRLR